MGSALDRWAERDPDSFVPRRTDPAPYVPPATRYGMLARPPAAASARGGLPPRLPSPPPPRPPTGLESKLRSLGGGGGHASRLTCADDSVGTSELGSLLTKDSDRRIAVPSFVFHRTHPGPRGPRTPAGGSSPASSGGDGTNPSSAYTFASVSPSTLASSRLSPGVPPAAGRGRGGGGDIFESITSHIFPVSIQVSALTERAFMLIKID